MPRLTRAQIFGFGSIVVEIVDDLVGRNMGHINVPGVLHKWLHVRVVLFGVTVFDGSWELV